MRSEAVPQPIKIAILAMGGEGGGVLADWIVDLGERNGHIAQSTSVPGVAQRTGATIYYVELFPRTAAERERAAPVLALMPLPGDVDIVLASELMEAGRAVQRGLVTQDRTTLIASTHRVYSIAEKTALADGRVDADNLLAHARGAAQRFAGFDMARAAEDAGSVISAVLFGALSGTGALPFAREEFEATIRRGGVGVKASLAAFDAAYGRVVAGDAPLAPDAREADVATQEPADAALRGLLASIRTGYPAPAQRWLVEGLRRVVDYQDVDYARLYLERMARIAAVGEPSLVAETARQLALAMSYEDTMRVAELKTRATRFDRVRAEVRAKPDQVLAIDEYLHPRVQEICETLPAALGRRLERPGWPRRLLERATRRGRIVTTSSLSGFALLSLVAAGKRWRRRTTRFAAEDERIERWLARVVETAASNPPLALEIAACQRLVKGYGDTHERGLSSYERVMAAVQRAGPSLAPATLRELREAALADERGEALGAALARHALA